MKKYYLSKIGETYGDLTVIDGGDVNRSVIVQCNECARSFKKNYQHLTNSRAITHEYCSKFINNWEVVKKTSFYSSWANMKTRVTNSNYAKFKNYGGREIKCDQFNYFVDFYDLMYDSYVDHVSKNKEHNTTIERIDVDKDYCLENCRWATWDEQAKNKTNTRVFRAISPEGKEYTVTHLPSFCEEHKIVYGNIIAAFSRNKGRNNVKLRTKWIFEVV